MGTNKGQMESGRETTRDAMTMEGHEELWRPKVPLVYQDHVLLGTLAPQGHRSSLDGWMDVLPSDKVIRIKQPRH